MKIPVKAMMPLDLRELAQLIHGQFESTLLRQTGPQRLKDILDRVVPPEVNIELVDRYEHQIKHVPLVPAELVTAYELILATVEYEVSRSAHWSHYVKTGRVVNSVPVQNFETVIGHYFLPMSAPLMQEKQWNLLNSILDVVIAQVRDFISNDTWTMHFLNMYGDTISINKTIDYRIYEWTRQQEEKSARSDEDDLFSSVSSVKQPPLLFGKTINIPKHFGRSSFHKTWTEVFENLMVDLRNTQ